MGRPPGRVGQVGRVRCSVKKDRPREGLLSPCRPSRSPATGNLVSNRSMSYPSGVLGRKKRLRTTDLG